MAKKLVRPLDYIEEIDGHLIFLAGPIKSAYDWQEKAIELISKESPDITIASPRVIDAQCGGDFCTKRFNQQVDWESYHLKRAGEKGCILFWLAKEYEHDCKRAYAQTSRFELGEWKTKHEILGTNIVVGIEEGFSNARYIKRRISEECPKVPICSSLEEACKEAIRLCNN
ncbi:MAG: nucleoside 2-deoxyribosyltransferase domain-containing protein [Nanoarchaeota archaeon]|nr:nucleoside 2-deoxyribosyltransferase domain-containing protein [Nanoarchaeota archaeon]MCG2718432.1 nucleoside 2-deoxyribosyltransferase domain-containing protein [Nanoarchaeota archaeon]